MDFTKLQNFDRKEWRLLQRHLYAIVFSAGRRTWGALTDEDLGDIAAEVYELAFERIADIEEDKFIAWITASARNMAWTRGKKKSALKSVEGKSDSIDELAEGGSPAMKPATKENPMSDLDAAERVRLFDELFSLLDPLDRELLWDRVVECMTGRELAEKYGWGEKGEKSASARIEQARKRAEKVFASHQKVAKLFAALQFEPPLP